MKTLLASLGFMVCFSGSVASHSGHKGKMADLKTAPPSHQVMGVEYCKGIYRVKFKDGSTFKYTEFNLRFKTDSGANGPKRGIPVQISAGMRGDRAYLVFNDPQEISSLLKKKC